MDVDLGGSLINIFSAAVIVCALRPVGIVYRSLSLYPLRWLGRISYGAYVYHDIFHSLYHDFYWTVLYDLVSQMARHFGTPFIFLQEHLRYPFVLFSFSATLLIAWLSFRFFEVPFLKLKERWTV